MKILIVDDEPIVRRALERALSRSHVVLTAEEGVSGLELWNKENPDVVLLDVLMPGLTGPQVLEKKGTWSSCVIVMSAYTGEDALDFQSKFAINLFLSKPFEDIFAIIKAIEQTADLHFKKKPDA